jgi:PPOX class probable F420-dependent enzyme
VQLPEVLIDRVLAGWPVARLAFSEAGGQPHALPLVFVRVASYVWSPIDGKPKRAGEVARVHHLQEQPRVELLLDDYSSDWDHLWWVRASGVARIVQPRDPYSDPDVAPVVQALRRKYPQYKKTSLLREPATLVAIRLERVRGWCAGEKALRGLEASGALQGADAGGDAP